MNNLTRKIGYGLGDMGTSIFWRIFSYYLPFFYSNIFGLTLIDAGVLVFATRIWDAVSDLMMGVIADRTNTKMGKYRPYLLWFAAPFAVCGILLFSTPDFSYAGKLLWACFTYVMMMTVYTVVNVPYAAMLGVITDNPKEKTVYAAYRMFFAYTGSFIALAFWDPLCSLFQELFGLSAAGGWQWAMVVIATICFFLFIISFLMTKEVVHPKDSQNLGYYFKSLLRNGPWWILIIAAMCSTLFTTLRGVHRGLFLCRHNRRGCRNVAFRSLSAILCRSFPQHRGGGKHGGCDGSGPYRECAWQEDDLHCGQCLHSGAERRILLHACHPDGYVRHVALPDCDFDSDRSPVASYMGYVCRRG